MLPSMQNTYGDTLKHDCGSRYYRYCREDEWRSLEGTWVQKRGGTASWAKWYGSNKTFTQFYKFIIRFK